MNFTTSGWYLALMALLAGSNLSLGLNNHFELNKSGLKHFVIGGILILLVIIHPLF